MTILTRIQSFSLRTKLGLTGAIGILIIVTLMTSLALSILRQDLRDSIAASQAALLDTVAKELDEKIAEQKRTISLAAGTLSQQDLMTAEALHSHFIKRPVLREHFDAIFIADSTGRIIYDTPQLPGRRGVFIANRDYFKSALLKGEQTISEPITGKTTYEPNIVFATPIKSPDGKIIGMIGGVMFLSRPNFLNALGGARIGDGGYFILASRAEQPMLVMHGTPSLVGMPVPDAKANPYLANAIAGFEGTVEGRTLSDAESIFSSKRLAAAPWVLLSVYPSSEAYSSLQASERGILGIALVLALLSGLAFWSLCRKLLDPLSALTEAMRLEMAHPGGPGGPSWHFSTKSKELVRLTSMYEALMEHKRHSQHLLESNERKVRAILDHAGDAFISMDGHGRITEWNQQAERTFGWSRDEAIGQLMSELIMPAEHREKHHAGMKRFIHAGAGPIINNRIEVIALHRSGREIPVELSVAAQKEGDIFVANAFLRDISAAKTAQKQLIDSENRLRAVTDNLPMFIGYIDREKIFRFCNATAERWFGIKPSDVLNRHVSEIVGGEIYDQIRPYLQRALSGERTKFELESHLGEKRGCHQTVYVPDRADDGSVLGVYTLSTDITSLKKAEKQLIRLARFDSLTGLPNRYQLNEKLPEAIGRSKRSKTAMAVMFLDIDHFKTINDTLGHAAGDAVLQAYAARLKAAVRSTDMVARLAGDEFVIILEGLNLVEEADLVAKKVIASVTKELLIGQKVMHITTSIGVAVFQGGECDADALLAQADKALYQAKEAGRNTYRLDAAAS